MPEALCQGARKFWETGTGQISANYQRRGVEQSNWGLFRGLSPIGISGNAAEGVRRDALPTYIGKPSRLVRRQ